jgi:CspA family cold shock protein
VIEYAGRVKFFDVRKGFGFLSCPSFPEGVFVGAKAALLPPGEHLADGDEVTFDIDADRDGRQRASNVRVTTRASPDERRARQAEPVATERDRRRPARERREARRERVWTHEGAGEP